MNARSRNRHGALSVQWTRVLLSPIGGAMRLFGWISDVTGSTNRLNRRNDEVFGEALRNSLPFVFYTAKGRLEKLPADEYKDNRSFDDSRAIVSTPVLSLRFRQVRGDLTIQAAPKARPSDWLDVATVLNWSDMKQGLPRRQYPSFGSSDLSNADDFLRNNWTRLQEALETQEI